MEEPLSFDSPIFREALKLISEIYPESEDVNEQMNGFPVDKEAIFQLSNYNLLQIGVPAEQKGALIPPFSFDAESEPKIYTFMYLAGVNPSSKNIEEATVFLEFLLENLAYDSNIALFPDQNDAVENKEVVNALEEIAFLLELDRKRLDIVSEENLAELKNAIAMNERKLSVLQDARFIVEKDDIEKMRSIERYMFISTESLYWTLTESKREDLFRSLLKRYASNNIHDEILIQELDRIMEMLYLEQ